MTFKKPPLIQLDNSFNLEVSCNELYLVSCLDDVNLLPDLVNKDFYILGDGSNTLFVDAQAPIIIKSNIQGINVLETPENYIITVGAGENWHDFVCYCTEQGFNGLENLALIPGSVGAAPVQNIGAYGVEFADVCHSVCYYDLIDKELVTLFSDQCDFKYRNSIFKASLNKRALIIKVTFILPKAWQPQVSYQGLDQLIVHSLLKK